MIGWIFLLLTVIFFSFAAFVIKYGGKRGIDPLGLSASMFFNATVISVVFIFFESSPNFSFDVVAWSIFGGVGGSVAYFLLVKALAIGHFGLTIAIMSSCFVIQVLYSYFAWGEPVKLYGIVLIITAIFLMALGGGSGEPKTMAPKKKWLILLMSAFFLNSSLQISQAAVSRLPGNNQYVYLLLFYLISSLIFIIPAVKNRLINKRVLKYGLLTAIGSFGGLYFSLLSLKTVSPNIVFPAYLSGYVMACLLLSFFAFKEKISKMGLFGIFLGIAGIIILCYK